MADYANSITVNTIMDTLSGLIRNFVGTAQIVRGQANRVAYPKAPFVMLTELRSTDLQVPHVEYDFSIGANSVTVNNAQRFEVQVDFYASNAGDMCSAVMSALRSSWGWDQFPENIRPLYTHEAIQAPLITGEQQYANRWILVTALQYNPSFTAPQQYASNATATTLLADS